MYTDLFVFFLSMGGFKENLDFLHHRISHIYQINCRLSKDYGLLNVIFFFLAVLKFCNLLVYISMTEMSISNRNMLNICIILMTYSNRKCKHNGNIHTG